MSDISTFAFTDLEGRTQSMRDYAGNVLLVVNVASSAGLRRNTRGCRPCGSVIANVDW